MNALKKYVVFSGRARRTEFWMFMLFNFIIASVLGIVGGLFGSLGILGSLYSLAVFLPSIAVAIRRLHDTNRSGWWLLIGLVPIVGAIILIIFMVQDSNPEQNSYGANPKA